MAPEKALAQLALQKRLLVAESEAQRLVLASALHRAAAPLRLADRIQSQARPLLMVGAPLAGFWIASRTKGMKRWVSTGLGVLRLAKSVRRFLTKSKPR
jgi:hypothetical protein